ncbi:MAG: hypothetical protein B0W54_16700 [Cellvibrio sp. 79]|nr:MAG: hypothetical protein B0W54_16700 [Cellvibrio sp. 79]
MKPITFAVSAILGLLQGQKIERRFDPGIDRIPLPILRRRKAPFFYDRIIGAAKYAKGRMELKE